MALNCSIDVVERSAKAVVVELVGEVDMANADEVGRQLAATSGERLLVVDLTNLQYLDSAGIRMLFDISERLSGEGRRLALALAPDAAVRKVLAITKLDTLVPVYDDVGGALQVTETG